MTYTGVTGNITGGAVTSTLNTGDILTGIGGTNTFNITGNGNTGGTPIVETSNIQNVNVRSVVDSEVNQVLMSGVTNLSSDGSIAKTSITNAQLGTTYGLFNTSNLSIGNADLTLTYQTASGTADKALLSVNNAGGKLGSTNITQTINTNVTAGAGDIEAIDLVTAGTNRVALTGGSKVANYTISGAGTNTISINGAASTMKVDASASTGTNSIDVGSRLTTTSSVVGGSGADTLKASLATGTQYISTISGVETLDFGFAAAAIFNAKNVTDVETLKLNALSTTNTLTNLNQGIDTVNIGTTTGIASGAVSLGYATDSNSDVSVILGATPTSGTASVVLTSLTASGNKGALDITSAGTANNTIGTSTLATNAIAANTATSISLAGDTRELTVVNKADLNGGGAAEIANATVSATAATAVTIDASLKAVSVTTTTNTVDAADQYAFRLDDSLSTFDIISGEGGATITGITNVAGGTEKNIDVTFNVESGKSAVAWNNTAAKKAAVVTAGTDSAVNATFNIEGGKGAINTGILEVVGATNKSYSANLTATATEGAVQVRGLTINDRSTTSTSASTVELNATGGDVTLGTLTLTASKATDLVVTAEEGSTAVITTLSGTSTLSTITASGDGVIELFKRVGGTANTDAVVGNTVIDASGATGGFLVNLEAAASTNNIVVTLGDAASTAQNTVYTGLGADVVYGGAGADFISTGAGADVINGGGGNDTIIGGLGNDNIDVGGGDDAVQYAAVTLGLTGADLAGATFYKDAITSFAVAKDSLAFTAGNLLAAGSNTTWQATLIDTGADDITSGTAAAIGVVTKNTNADFTTAGTGEVNFIKFSAVDATSFATAIGTAVITTDAIGADNKGVLASYYNATSGKAIVGMLLETDGTGSAFDKDDTFVTFAEIEMTAADYTTGISIANFIA